MSRFKMPEPRKEGRWIEHYNNRRLRLCRGVEIYINSSLTRDVSGYGITFLDRSPKERVESVDQAKRVAIAFARKVINEADAALKEIEAEMAVEVVDAS